MQGRTHVTMMCVTSITKSVYPPQAHHSSHSSSRGLPNATNMSTKTWFIIYIEQLLLMDPSMEGITANGLHSIAKNLPLTTKAFPELTCAIPRTQNYSRSTKGVATAFPKMHATTTPANGSNASLPLTLLKTCHATTGVEERRTQVSVGSVKKVKILIMCTSTARVGRVESISCKYARRG